MIFTVFTVEKYGDRHAQVAKKILGEGTSAASGQKEVVDVDKIPELVVLADKVTKRKESTEVAPEKMRKKIRTISLAKKKKEECVTNIHVHSADEPNVCTLHAGTTLVKPGVEKTINDLELEAKTILPQVSGDYL